MEPIQAILDQKGRELHIVARDATVLDAVGTMCRAHVGAVLVMEGDQLCGIFSERDLMSRVVLAGKEPSKTPVAEVMTTQVTSIAPDVSAHDAMSLMTDRRVRHLPVAEGRRIVGLVSIGDLVRWTLHDREAEIAHLQDYVSGRYPG